MKKHLLILSFAILLLPLITSAGILDPIELNLEYPSFGGLDINEDQELGDIVAWFYYLIVGISGLAAFAMLVFGGIQWLSSAGSTKGISAAKERIKNALLGLLLILGSFLVLQIINPELTFLNTPELGNLEVTPPGIGDVTFIDTGTINDNSGDGGSQSNTGCLNSLAKNSILVSVSPIGNTGHIVPLEGGSGNATVTSDCTHSYNPSAGDYEIGIDLAGISGKTVVASLGGKITFVAKNVTSNCYNDISTCEANGGSASLGNYIEILNNHGEVERYSHFATVKNNITVGSTVSQGQALGIVGNTGYSSGAHLHWTVYKYQTTGYPSRNPFENTCDKAGEPAGWQSPC